MDEVAFLESSLLYCQYGKLKPTKDLLCTYRKNAEIERLKPNLFLRTMELPEVQMVGLRSKWLVCVRSPWPVTVTWTINWTKHKC